MNRLHGPERSFAYPRNMVGDEAALPWGLTEKPGKELST